MEKTGSRDRSISYAFNKALTKRIHKFIQVVLIARNFDTAFNMEMLDEAGRKRRAKAFLSDKELQVAIYLAMTKLKKRAHSSKAMSMQNLTLILNSFENYVSAKSKNEKADSKGKLGEMASKSNQALISRTLNKLAKLELIKYIPSKKDELDNSKKNHITIKFNEPKSIEYHVELMSRHSKVDS